MSGWEKEWGDILFEKRGKMNEKWIAFIPTIPKIKFYCSLMLKIVRITVITFLQNNNN